MSVGGQSGSRGPPMVSSSADPHARAKVVVAVAVALAA